MTVLVVAEAVVIGLLAILVIGLLRRNAELLQRLQDGDAAAGEPDPSAVGVLARDIAGVALNGQVVGIQVHESDRPTLLAFMSTVGATCEHFWKQFADPEAMASLGNTRLIIVTYGHSHERPTEVASLAPPGVPLVMSTIAWQTYGIEGSPNFVMISADTGRITAKGSALSWEGLLGLVGLSADNR